MIISRPANFQLMSAVGGIQPGRDRLPPAVAVTLQMCRPMTFGDDVDWHAGVPHLNGLENLDAER